MTNGKLSDEVLQMIEENAWQDLYVEFQWTESLLEKYQNKVDWDEVSSNRIILWTASMLEKFKDRINWHRLSECGKNALFSIDNIERFQDYWDWEKISFYIFSYQPYSIELIEKYADRWDWSAIITNYEIKEYLNEDFLNRFYDYISTCDLRHSFLLDNLVKARKEKIIKEIHHFR